MQHNLTDRAGIISRSKCFEEGLVIG